MPLILQQFPVGLNAISFVKALNKVGFASLNVFMVILQENNVVPHVSTFLDI